MSSMLRYALPVLGIVAFACAQTPDTHSPRYGTIEGNITDSVTGQPVPGARLKLDLREGHLYAKCDGNGHFEFRDVPYGGYQVSAQGPHYFDSSESLSVQNERTSVHISLKPYGVISGRITDAGGAPVPGAIVDALTIQPADGSGFIRTLATRRALIGKQEISSRTSVRTNDIGEYRLALLEPGSYYVGAAPPLQLGHLDRTERVTYYPRVVRVEKGKAVAVAPGQEVNGVDIQIIRQAGVRVSGRIARPGGAPKGRSVLVHTSLVAWRPDAPQEESSTYSWSANSDDTFELSDVLPGTYVIEATTADSTDFVRSRRLEAGRQTIVVGSSDIQDLEIPMRAAFDVPGTVTFDEGCPAIPVLVSAMGFSRTGSIIGAARTTGGAFSLTGFAPGPYTFGAHTTADRMGAGYSYSVASINLGERDVSKQPVELSGEPAGTLQVHVKCVQISSSGRGPGGVTR